MQGLTRHDIAHNIGITVDTLARWQIRYPELREALRESRAVADVRVEGALYKRAIGYDVTETKSTVVKHPDGTQTVKQEKFDRHIPPDTSAQIFWLKNRKPQDWRDRREFEVDGTVGLVQIIDDLKEG
jgi:hypothetical protein